MSLASRKLIQATAGATTVDTGDDDFANVVLLLDGDGTSGDNNETFTDSSTNGFTVTESGSVVQGSFSPYGDNWSNSFDGNSDYISIADSTDFDFGTGDWTVECWFNRTGGSTRVSQVVFNQSVIGASSNSALFLGAGNNGLSLYLSTSGTSWTNFIETSTAPSLNAWSHCVWQRRGNTLEIYLDGTLQTVVSGSSSFSGTIFNSSRNIEIGTQSSSAYLTGYLSNLRVLKGTALYTSSFTPPTAPLAAVTNTVLLACQSNRFIDNSSSSHTLTPAGTASVTPFSPFKDDDARDITTDGGSAYFNYGPYLTLPQNTAFNFGTGDFTVEFWANVDTYRTSGSYFDCFVAFGHYTSSPYIRITHSGTVTAGLVGSSITGTTVLNKHEWYHIALTRSGTTVRLFVNGVLEATSTSSSNMGNSSSVYIGTSAWLASAEEMKGYLSDVRIVKGTAVHTASFTPPTAPLTAVTNTSALLSLQDAAIYDRSGINNLDTVGNAQIDTAVKKYGTGSMQFDGSGDYLEASYVSDLFDFDTADWTMECWVYLQADSDSRGGIIEIYKDDNNYIRLFRDSGPDIQLRGLSGGTTQFDIQSSAQSQDTWIHVAGVRDGSTIRLFLDGTQVGTDTSFSIPDLSDARVVVGLDLAGTDRYFTGYLDDLRVTKGVARYTSAFTPPAAALPKF